MFCRRISTYLNKYHSKSFDNVEPRRKYPVDPKQSDNIPIFQYASDKGPTSRVYVWGRGETGALGLGLSKRNNLSVFKYPKRQYFAEKNDVIDIACGYGFTIFAVQSVTNQKLYGSGLNTDSQLGYQAQKLNKPLATIIIPQAINLPIKNSAETQVLSLSAGRAHAAILTDEGVFTIGNNAYGQCGRKIIKDEKYLGNSIVNQIPDVNGDKIKSVECGQDHTFLLSTKGTVYSCGWGADGQTGLGHYNNESNFMLVQGDIKGECIVKVASTVDTVLALNDKGDVFGWGNSEYSQLFSEDQQLNSSMYLKPCSLFGKIVDIACGGSFCMILNEEGNVFVWGYGLLGKGPEVQHSKQPTQIPSTLFGKNAFQPETQVTSINCGISHMAAVNSNGDLFMWGHNRTGVLGLGDMKDQYFPLKVSVGAKVKKISCGVDHSVALCESFI